MRVTNVVEVSITVVRATFTPPMHSAPTLQLVGGLTISISFLFAGLFIPRSSYPPFWIGLYYAVPTSHVLRALATNQFFCEGPNCPIITVVEGTTTMQVSQSDFVAQFVDSTFQQRWGQYGWAALAAVVMIVIAIFSLRFINYQQR